MTKNTKAEKYRQRQICFEKRRALTEEEREAFSREICRRVSELPEFKEAKTVFSYLATYDEADPSYLPEEGKVYVRRYGGVLERLDAVADICVKEGCGFVFF